MAGREAPRQRLAMGRDVAGNSIPTCRVAIDGIHEQLNVMLSRTARGLFELKML